MKLPRRFVTKLSLAAVLAALAGLGWAVPEATAGAVHLDPAGIIYESVYGDANVGANARSHPNVHATVDGGSPGVSNAAIAFLYAFAVNGPATAKSVDLNITFSAGYTFGNLIWGRSPESQNTSIQADGEVILDGSRIFRVLTGEFATAASSDFIVDDDKIELDAVAPNVEHFVELSAEISASDLFDNPHLHGTVFVDPVITFAPGFDSTGYSLEFSPGVGNEPDSGPGTATPEPSTLVLSSILFGMWGVVWAYKQRKRTRAAA